MPLFKQLTISALLDVTESELVEGSVIIFDATENKWILTTTLTSISNPPSGSFGIDNMFVKDGKLVVEYDDDS